MENLPSLGVRLATGAASPAALAPALAACAQLLHRRAAAAAAGALCEVAAPAHGSLGAGPQPPHLSQAGSQAVAGVRAAAAAVTHGGAPAATAVASISSRCRTGGESGSASGAGGQAGGGGGGGGGGGAGRRSWWRQQWRAAGGGGAAAAAAAAALAAGGAAAAGWAAGAAALAEAPDEAPLLEALAAARTALAGAWAEVEQDLGRINARLPAHAPRLEGVPPSVALVHGAVEVAVPLREGADAEAVLREMRDAFRGRGSTAYSESYYGASRTVHLEARPDPRQPEGAVRLQLFVPSPGGEERAQLTVSKRAPFTPEELAALGRLTRAANLTFAADRPAAGRARRHGLHGGLPGPEGDALARELEEALGQLGRAAFGGFVGGPLRQMMEELQRGLEGLEEGLEGAQPFGGAARGQGDDDEGSGAPPPALGRHRGPKRPDSPPSAPPEGHEWGSPAAARAVEGLAALGAQVFPPGGTEKLDWGVLAGYEEQKRTIEDCLLLPLLRPDVYARLAAATRRQAGGSSRPRAVLFEGPPGTGKTTSARVIASQAAVPLIYLPLEAVLSKWYGQSEGQLAQVFKAAEAMGGAIIFLDELDALGGNRESGGMHEVSRRLLSVLLREMEGFDAAAKRTVVIGATNRKADLDPALLSRFDLVLTFGLPDADCRRLILAQYAAHLPAGELAQLAGACGGMAGRDLRDVAEHTERRWASRIIRGEEAEGSLPPLAEYLASARERQAAVRATMQAAAQAGEAAAGGPAAAALAKLLGGGGGGGGGLPGWLSGRGQ